MRKKFFLFLVLWAYFICLLSARAQEIPNIAALEPFRKNDHVLILAPHPDDETIACAGIIQQALKAGAKVNIVYLTNGEHNQVAFMVYKKMVILTKDGFIRMGETRRQEAIAAMKSLGLSEKDLIFLGYPDCGAFAIFSRRWQAEKPFQSLMTRISSVPYKTNFSYAAPYKGESILSDLKSILLKFRPNKIFVSHPADVNLDHRALYSFLQIALRDLEKQILSPKVYPYLIHCVGWPKPRHYHPELTLEPPQQFMDSQISWQSYTLSPTQLVRKHKAALNYKSQTMSSAFYLLSFARKNELFGDYPEVELAKQASLKEKAVSFFGFSNMFMHSDIQPPDTKNISESKGRVSYAVEDEMLFIRIEKPAEFYQRFGLQVYLFGYSHKTPFAQMPKIRMVTMGARVKIFNAKNKINPKGVYLEMKPKELFLKVPLGILGEPDFILASVKSYGGRLPFDATAFRRIAIK